MIRCWNNPQLVGPARLERGRSGMMLFVKPSLTVYRQAAAAEGYSYIDRTSSYAEYNYLRPGFTSRLKYEHFELALRLTRRYFHTCNVIDFGCADGIFVPSLSLYFNKVAAVDKRRDFVNLC